MTIGEKIKELREEKGMTLEEVGNIVGVGKSTVRKWETGMIANMRRDKIAKLASALGTTPAYLMGWTEETSPESPTDGQGKYYLNDETARVAQEVFDDPDLRMLFNAARDAKPEDIRLAAEMLKRFKETNPDG